MSYDTPGLQQILERFRDLRQAPHGGGRAPHKPLLILLMLGRHQRGERDFVLYESIREPLAELLRDFGPPTTGRPNTEDPFWRLQNDRGKIWIVRDRLGGIVSEETAPPQIGRLIEKKAEGNFSEDIRQAFAEHPEYTAVLASELLAAHFPPSLHEDVCASAGVVIGSETLGAPPDEAVRARDAGFRGRVIRAYEYKCAITGWDLRIGHASAGLEAAHIKWHVAGGPSTETNGLALNALHHKLFDLGAFTLSLEDEIPLILVSQECHGGSAVEEMFMRFHRKPIRIPQDLDWLPSREFIAWHQEEVFKRPARR